LYDPHEFFFHSLFKLIFILIDMRLKTAFILAGGKATRLGDLGKEIPKALLPIKKQTYFGKNNRMVKEKWC